MPEKKLRSILLAVALWALMFIVSMLAAYKLDERNVSIFTLLVIPVFTVLLAYVYMRSPKEKSVYEGARLGFTWFVVLLTLDVIVRVYIMESGWEYFRSWTVWIAFGEIVFFCTLIGALMKPIETEKSSGEVDKKSGKSEEKKESTKKAETYFQ